MLRDEDKLIESGEDTQTNTKRRFTKAIRQEIIKEFASRHDGQFDAKLFFDEVYSLGSGHPAYDWFDWNDASAAYQHRLWQARVFADGLQIKWRMEQLQRDKTVVVIERDAPLALSPLAGRAFGGGYYLTDPDNPEHLRELCQQAATSLTSWMARYGVALAHVGHTAKIARLILALEDAGARRDEVA